MDTKTVIILCVFAAISQTVNHYLGYRAGYNRGYDDSRQARGRWRFWLAGPPDWNK